MTAERWPGDCGDVIAADPYGRRVALTLHYALRYAIYTLGHAIGMPADEQRELYKSVVGYDPDFWAIPNDPSPRKPGPSPNSGPTTKGQP